MGIGSSIERKYGWRRDDPDERDLYHDFSNVKPSYAAINEVDLRKYCPEVYDQLNLGSCAANAISAAYEFDEIIQKEPKDEIFRPSRLFVYYNERELEGTTDKDSGASIRDSVKTIVSTGVCPESMWEYDVEKFTQEPTKMCYAYAHNHRAIEYKRVDQRITDLKRALIEGFPIVFGFIVYEHFESSEMAHTGVMKMPDEDEKILGGHAVVAVGFSDEKQSFLIRNSWGKDWGLEGYFWMPYEFIMNSKYAADFWTITRVKDRVENREENRYIDVNRKRTTLG